MPYLSSLVNLRTITADAHTFKPEKQIRLSSLPVGTLIKSPWNFYVVLNRKEDTINLYSARNGMEMYSNGDTFFNCETYIPKE